MTEPTRAVFLSYASQDAQAAKRICEALRGRGVEVWFDQSELRGGDAWDRQIRKQIHDCALFIPIISAHSQSRLEGYFRREWKLAADRTHDMAEEKAFLVPVVVDQTAERSASVPDKFHDVQWTHLPAGETPPAFVERVSGLLSRDEHSVQAAGGMTGVRGSTASHPLRPILDSYRLALPVRLPFLQELMRRNVVRLGVLYVAVCWLILEPFRMLFTLLELPAWTGRGLLLLMAVGLPLVLTFGWVFEVTPSGLKPTVEVDPRQSIAKQTGRRLDRAIIAVLALALTYFMIDKFWLSKRVVDTARAGAETILTADMTGESASVIQLGLEELARNPLATGNLNPLAFEYYSSGQFEAAARMSRRLIEMNSAYRGAHELYALTLLAMHKPADALAEAEKEADEEGRLAILALVYWDLARRGDADAMLHQLEVKFGDSNPFDIAEIYAYRGEPDAAFVWLEHAYTRRATDIVALKVDRMLASLHGDPRYKALLRKMKIPE